MERIAFLMAWNKRLGSDSIISHIVCKDVAKLIAKYIHEDKSDLAQPANNVIGMASMTYYNESFKPTLLLMKTNFSNTSNVFEIIQHTNTFYQFESMAIKYYVDDIDKKRTLVAEITEALKKAYNIPTSAYPIVIHENPPENVGVNGKLIFDKIKNK